MTPDDATSEPGGADEIAAARDALDGEHGPLDHSGLPHRHVSRQTGRMPVSEIVPAAYRALLEQPLYGHLGTIRPDDTVQVNPMWFEFDGEHVRFTHTTYRQKYRNLQHNPSMSLSILDPDDPFRYLEVRGRLVEEIADPEGAFYVRLQNRYGNLSQTPPPDKAERVILVMSIERATKK